MILKNKVYPSPKDLHLVLRHELWLWARKSLFSFWNITKICQFIWKLQYKKNQQTKSTHSVWLNSKSACVFPALCSALLFIFLNTIQIIQAVQLKILQLKKYKYCFLCESVFCYCLYLLFNRGEIIIIMNYTNNASILATWKYKDTKMVIRNQQCKHTYLRKIL